MDLFSSSLLEQLSKHIGFALHKLPKYTSVHNPNLALRPTVTGHPTMSILLNECLPNLTFSPLNRKNAELMSIFTLNNPIFVVAYMGMSIAR
uniref:Putative ovule protein n=1 Tax=Solanum chacoense TaxID=4108 RepID=A0A0V0GSC5_SOLCH